MSGHETASLLLATTDGSLDLVRGFAAVCVCGWCSDVTTDGFKMLADRYDHLIATGTFRP